MKKIFLRLFEKFIFKLSKYNLHMVRDIRKKQEEKDERKFALVRYKTITNEFEFSKENLSKISELNDLLSKKTEQLFDTALELCEMFVHLQETGHDDFYEFIIKGEINVSDSYESKTTPFADEETAERIWAVSGINDLTPRFELELNYNSDFMFIYRIKEKFLEPVQHTGVFANPVFDEMKICRAMDVIFNKQKCYTLQDAIYMNAESFQSEFVIETAKRLWVPDKKNKNILYNAIMSRKMSDRFMNKKIRRTNFNWSYDNKMKVFEIADRTTELLYHLYDESFVLQKLFIEKQKEGKDIFNDIWISGMLKYLGDEVTPIANKKMSHYLREAANSCGSLTDVNVSESDEWSEKGCEQNVFLSVENGEVGNCNFEDFDKLWVGNHKINYFMHSLFVDESIYTLHDILYMKSESWNGQFHIILSQ